MDQFPEIGLTLDGFKSMFKFLIFLLLINVMIFIQEMHNIGSLLIIEESYFPYLQRNEILIRTFLRIGPPN